MSEQEGQRTFQVGEVVAGRFEVMEALGASEGGRVYLVRETERDRRMVLKHLAIPYVGDEGYEVLRNEIMEASAIRHKNLVQVFGLGKEGEELFLAMEHVEGETLDAHLKSRREKGQIMGLKAAYNVIAHICNALQAVHEVGAVHGALTPRNIYITRQGRVKVANLVYAKLVSRYLAAEQRGAYFDSPYIAPEAQRGESDLGPQADMYSLGLITAELLSDAPLEGSGMAAEAFVEHVVSARSPGIQELLFSAVVAVAEHRMSSVNDFKEGLKQALDAPSDTELSSIVMGMSELRDIAGTLDSADDDGPTKRKPDLFDMPGLPPPKGSRLFGGDAFPAPSKRKGEQEEEIWLVQKDGLDYGPFTRLAVLEMLHKDEIDESTATLNMLTQRRAELVDIPDFREAVLNYLPVRNERRAREAAERERKIENVKTGAKVSVLGLVLGAGAIIALSVIAYLQLPDPIPMDFAPAIAAFPHTFEVPKVEEVNLNVDAKQAMALFDPKASDAEREAALRAWEAEHTKRIASKRKGRPAGRPGGRPGARPGDDDFSDIQEITFGDEDGNEVEPLFDWEVEEQLYSARSLRRQSECFLQYAGGRRQKVTVDFVIVQTGQVRRVTTTASGDLDECLRAAFSTLRFRSFGGTIKRVSYPMDFG